jgi:GNAT superfamily N-acetyltransferase
MPQEHAELAESIYQFITIWKLIGSPFPNADQLDKPGLAVSWPDTAFPFYNAIFLSEHASEASILEDKVQQAAAYMRTRRHGGLFLICLDSLSGSAKGNLASIVMKAKLIPAIPMTGMASDILPLKTLGHHSLRFVRIEDDATILAFAEINCSSYSLPATTAFSLIKEHSLWKEQAYGFLAYEGDKPVATATAIVNDGCIFLFLVATLPEAQRKGYGEAVVRHALQAAHQATGIRRTILHATDAGAPIYLRLGYHPTVKFMGYVAEV